MRNEPIIDFPTETIREGKTNVLVPKLKAFAKLPSEYAPSKAPVFYNPVMELNRDFAVIVLQVYQRQLNRDISVCEPLASCGIRGVRFATEVEGVRSVVMGDISQRAVRLAEHNVRLNGLEGCAVVKHQEANALLSGYSAPHKRFDVVDIDPFGSPVPYIDSAVRALRDGGLLALTATDMAPLCGVHSKACVRKYGGRPLRTEYCHELAVRLLIGCLARTAAKYSIGVRMLFSHSSDHYVRVYATIGYGARKADEALKNMGYLLHCFRCFHREIVKESSLPELLGECSECGSKISYAGPLWLGNIFQRDFCELAEADACQRGFKLAGRISRTLILARDEAEAPISYYVIDKLCSALSLPVPSIDKVIEALTAKGFQAFPTHFNTRGVRSDVPALKMQDVLQELAGLEKANFK